MLQFYLDGYILSRDGVTIDGVWISNLIYWTLAERKYKLL
jgi:hypothetical protein